MTNRIDHNQPLNTSDDREATPVEGALSNLFSQSVGAVYASCVGFAFRHTWQVESISTLPLALGANPNIRIDPFGWTPLHAAVESGNRKLVRQLLENGADPNLLHDAGWSPFHVAIYLNNPEIIHDLMEAGADFYETTIEEVNEKTLPLSLWEKENAPNEKRTETSKQIRDCFKCKSSWLGLWDNNLTSLPAEIGLLSNLKELYLNNNQLSKLPPEIGQLSALKNLYLDSSQLTGLPPEIGQLFNLQEFYLGSNRLSVLPPEIGLLLNLRELYLNDNQLTGLPPEIGQLSALQKLNLSGNQLTELPSEIGLLSNLKELCLSSNQLTGLPKEIGQLSALQILNLSGNQLTGLPPEIRQLSALQILNLNGNQLTELPPEIGQLSALQKLYLKGNQLTELPLEIGQLSNLQELYLDSNPNLTSLPEEVLQLPVACTIQLSRTGLSQAVRDSLQEATRAPNYNGPRFSFSIQEVYQDARSIEEIMQDLESITQSDPINISNLVVDEELKEILCTWLNRLSYISEFKEGGEKSKQIALHILFYLNLAQTDADYRETFFACINGAADTCGDRMATSVMELGIQRKLQIIPIDNYKALARFIGNTMWPIELLKDVARAKIETLRGFFDEIETYLAYPVKLKLELGLDIDIDDMLYGSCSNVTDEDLEHAKNFILEHTQNKKSYCLYLAKNDKWVEVLKLHYEQEVEVADTKRHEDYDNDAYHATLARLTEQLLGEKFFSHFRE